MTLGSTLFASQYILSYEPTFYMLVVIFRQLKSLTTYMNNIVKNEKGNRVMEAMLRREKREESRHTVYIATDFAIVTFTNIAVAIFFYF